MLTFDEYQALARRTQNQALTHEQKTFHALTGLASEVGEVMSLFQHAIQEAKPLDDVKLKKEIGDCQWFIAELCDCIGLSMGDVASLNIEKLKARYPEGFDVDRSINRTDR